jgi:UDP-N-acetylglucosamine acyltransferase
MVGGVSGVSKDVPPYTIVAGHRATLHGLNLIGFQRNEFPPESVSELKTAYKILFRSGLPLQKAFEAVKEENLCSPEVHHLIEFIQNSERGIIR